MKDGIGSGISVRGVCESVRGDALSSKKGAREGVGNVLFSAEKRGGRHLELRGISGMRILNGEILFLFLLFLFGT